MYFFRNFFCCLLPTSGGEPILRAADEGPVVIRPPSAPTLPTWFEPCLGPAYPRDVGKKLLVLDLDETLVHSSFKPVPSPDYIIPVDIEGRIVDVYVIKRPFVDHFLRAVGQRFEVVVFTASLGKYADPLLDLLDRSNVVRWRLFREACYPYEGSYVKDLQCLGRDLAHTIIVDNSPHSYVFQPENAVPIGTFIDDPEDRELLECLDMLLAVENAPDVRTQLGTVLARKDAGLMPNAYSNDSFS
jgi:carboxy-terminal domain RNA polymerase II polypeptide A small phosphatase